MPRLLTCRRCIRFEFLRQLFPRIYVMADLYYASGIGLAARSQQLN